MPDSTQIWQLLGRSGTAIPHKVDVPVPEGGPGSRTDAMEQWCRQNVGEWAHHSHTERGQIGERFRYFARFYFMAEQDAEQFRQAWAEAGPHTSI